MTLSSRVVRGGPDDQTRTCARNAQRAAPRCCFAGVLWRRVERQRAARGCSSAARCRQEGVKDCARGSCYCGALGRLSRWLADVQEVTDLVRHLRGNEDLSGVRQPYAPGHRQRWPLVMGHIVFLRVETDSLPLAKALAIEMVDTMRLRQPELDPVSTQVSDEGKQDHRLWVLCSAWVGDGRCVRPDHHPGDHSPDWPC
jgi:hypothetical protein